ncbi:MAG TPA: methyltransferase domain-containing protein [Ohtaekwangia sp.]
MPDFSARSVLPEIMDDLECRGEVVDQTLRELEFINAWLGGNDVTVSGVKKMVKGISSSRTITLVDLGCGGGDMLRILYHWAKRNGVTLRLIGIDANPHIIDFARNNIKDIPEIEFYTMDIFSEEFRQQKFDIVTGTLFYHHFTQQQLSSFFHQLKSQARIGIVINDIHRHPLAYYSIRILTQLFSKSSMVKYDAPLSVLRAFSRAEVKSILAAAAIEKFSLRWRWAFRWQVLIPLKEG